MLVLFTLGHKYQVQFYHLESYKTFYMMLEPRFIFNEVVFIYCLICVFIFIIKIKKIKYKKSVTFRNGR